MGMKKVIIQGCCIGLSMECDGLSLDPRRINIFSRSGHVSAETKGGWGLGRYSGEFAKTEYFRWGPKRMILECIVQLFEAIKFKIFSESSITILKSKMAIFRPEITFLGFF